MLFFILKNRVNGVWSSREKGAILPRIRTAQALRGNTIIDPNYRHQAFCSIESEQCAWGYCSLSSHYSRSAKAILQRSTDESRTHPVRPSPGFGSRYGRRAPGRCARLRRTTRGCLRSQASHQRGTPWKQVRQASLRFCERSRSKWAST